jgi:hypothetical protein
VPLIYVYILTEYLSTKNHHSAKKYSLRGWLARRKAGLKRIGNAKNIQSSLLFLSAVLYTALFDRFFGPAKKIRDGGGMIDRSGQ